MEFPLSSLPNLNRIFDRALQYIDFAHANCNSRGNAYSNSQYYTGFEEGVEAHDLDDDYLGPLDPAMDINSVEPRESWEDQFRPKRYSDDNREDKNEIAQESEKIEYPPKDGSSYVPDEDSSTYKESDVSPVTSLYGGEFSDDSRKHGSSNSGHGNTQSHSNAKVDGQASIEASETGGNPRKFTFNTQEGGVEGSEEAVEKQDNIRESTAALDDLDNFQKASYQPQDLASGSGREEFTADESTQSQFEISTSSPQDVGKSQSSAMVTTKESTSALDSEPTQSQNGGSFLDNGSKDKPTTNNQGSHGKVHVGSNGGDSLDKDAPKVGVDNKGYSSEGYSSNGSREQQTTTGSGGKIGGNSTEVVNYSSY
ncbi:hypothetical protein CDD82_7562 [Ophiocordyceps australis]|uniref:Uncharacterized protein n=1 Tax=Ophiocordyceps australis TaxID=1399860 RepID=A0A2C5YQV6_9HYPO|nr:hypothetical protein CDD82_7562 [Ophiocordyceps australis]